MERIFTKLKIFRTDPSSPNSQKGCTNIRQGEGHGDPGRYKRRQQEINRYRLSMLKIWKTTQDRTFMSIIGGVIAGIFGFTGLTGFVFYFIVMAITSAGFAAKAEFSVHSYFDSSNKIMLDGVLGGLMSFVLFWTFAYDFVHIF